MRARVLLWASLGLNILLVAMVVLVSRDTLQGIAPDGRRSLSREPAKQFKTNVVVRRQGFTWGEVESTDFRNYITNLRRIGCPEKTIRDIIVAEVDDLFVERMAREINLPEQKWWLPEPDMDALETGMDQFAALEREKAVLLTQLLGVGWDRQRNMAGGNAIRFDGAVLSKLAPETKSAVERIESNARRARAEAEQSAQQEGRAVDPGQLADLRQDLRRQLASVLTPEQLEEYLLRYSPTAEQMRDELLGYGAEADEFRRIFRARDSFEQQLAALNSNDPGTPARRVQLERARDEAIRQAVGPERFAFYQVSQSPLFRQAQDMAEQSGAPAEKVLPLFRINQAVQDEIARIQSDQTLTADQKRVAVASVQQQQQNSVDRILASETADTADTVATTANQQGVPMPPMPELPPAAFDASRNPRGPIAERMQSIDPRADKATITPPVLRPEPPPISRGPVFGRTESKSRPSLAQPVTEAPRGGGAPPSPKGPVFDRIP